VKGRTWHELSVSLYGLHLAKASSGHEDLKVTGNVYTAGLQFDLKNTHSTACFLNDIRLVAVFEFL
jgi:hypothetical protein